MSVSAPCFLWPKPCAIVCSFPSKSWCAFCSTPWTGCSRIQWACSTPRSESDATCSGVGKKHLSLSEAERLPFVAQGWSHFRRLLVHQRQGCDLYFSKGCGGRGGASLWLPVLHMDAEPSFPSCVTLRQAAAFLQVLAFEFLGRPRSRLLPQAVDLQGPQRPASTCTAVSPPASGS